MRKKSHSSPPDAQPPSDQDNSEDSFVFELFGEDDEDDEDESDYGLGFTLGGEASEPYEDRAALNGAYCVSSTEEPGMVEDLGAPAPRPPSPPPIPSRPTSGDLEEGVLGRIALRTVTAKEILDRQAGIQAPANGARPVNYPGRPPVHQADPAAAVAASPVAPPQPPSHLEEPLPSWFEDADQLDIAWPWEDSEPESAATAPAPVKGAAPAPVVSRAKDPEMRAAMDGMVKAALEDWGDDTTDALAGFDAQPTVPLAAKKMEKLGRYLEKIASRRQDVLRVFLPSQAPLPPDLDAETRQKVEETRALFQNLYVVLQSIWSEGGCQLVPGGPIILDMAMVGPAYDWLKDLLKRRGELRLELSPYELLLHGRTVMKSENERDNPFFHLYKEGVRLMTLLPGLTEQEFKELFRVLTHAAPGDDDPMDTTTQVWELDLPHLKISSTGATPDQLLGFMGVETLAEHRSLVRKLNKSLHGENAFTAPISPTNGQGGPLLEQVLRLRLELVRSLDQVSGEDAYRQVRAQIGNLGAEQMQRVVHTLLEMMGSTGQGANGVQAALNLLRQLLVTGRWDEVSVFCRTLGQASSDKNPEPVSRSASLVLSGLGKLLDRRMLRAMEPALNEMTREQFHGFRELTRILPKAADMGLAMVTEHVQNDEIREMVFEVIRELGIDVELLLTRRLLSENDNEVLEGIAVLQEAPSEGSLDALRSTLVHPNPRVRIAALKVLKGHLTEAMIPDLVDSLELDSDQLKNCCFDLLPKLPPAKVAIYLIPLLESVGSQWTSAHRRRAIGVLAKAGDNESLGFLITHITTRNLLRDTAVEEFRNELIETLAETGGMFARKVLTDCLDRGWSFGGSKAVIQDALNKILYKS